MDGFKTPKRTGVAVSAGDRMSVGALAIEVGGLTDTVQVKAEAPLVQAPSGERSFTVDREAVENLPIANRSFMALAFLAPGVSIDDNNTPTRIGGGGDPNIMMDGVSAMDTGSNRPLLQMNVESIAEVKVLDVGLPGRVRARQRRADHRRHQERHQPLPRVGLRRGAQFGLVREQQDQQAQRRPQGDPEGERLGLSRSAARSASRAATTSCSSSTPRNSRRARPGNNVVRYRMPTALERAGDFSQSTDNNGNPFPTSRIRS